MPKRKTKKNNVSQIKWGESYTSLFLGIIVVVVIGVLFFSFLKNNRQMGSTQSSSTTAENQILKPTSYVVKQDDNLWKISEKMYGSGYNWVDITKANKISNPDLLFVGVKLVIPNVKPIRVNNVSTMAEPIKENLYTVKLGDNLWNIALRAYGDGYKWTQLSNANKLTKPDIIHVGNIIKIPR